MTWTQPITDFRTQLSDGAKDKLRYRKQVIGQVDGVNKRFKTLEFRRLTDFIAPVGNLGVYINGVQTVLTDVTLDFAEVGEFELATAPVNGDRIEATYYIQWFTDDELTVFLRIASNWLAMGDDFTAIASGLIPSTMCYAQGEAFEKLALRWSERLSETFLMQDQTIKDQFALVETYQKWGAEFKKQAHEMRKDFYSRAGQNEQPSFGNIFGSVPAVVPKR